MRTVRASRFIPTCVGNTFHLWPSHSQMDKKARDSAKHGEILTRPEGSLVAMLELRNTRGRTINVPVHLDRKNMQGLSVNMMSSVFGREEKATKTPKHRWFVEEALRNYVDNSGATVPQLRYLDTEKISRWGSSVGESRAVGHLIRRFGSRVPTQRDLVNIRSENPGFYQGGTRGQVDLSEGQTIIRLFEKADKSTFAHETAHVFLDDLAFLAQGNGQGQGGSGFSVHPHVRGEHKGVRLGVCLGSPRRP